LVLPSRRLSVYLSSFSPAPAVRGTGRIQKNFQSVCSETKLSEEDQKKQIPIGHHHTFLMEQRTTHYMENQEKVKENI